MALLAALWPGEGEGDNIADGWAVGEEHEPAVDTDAEAGRGRHAVLQRLEELLVQPLRLAVARLAQALLLLEARPLVQRVVELREAVADLGAGHRHLEALDAAGVRGIALGERRDINGVVDEELRPDERRPYLPLVD